MARSSHCKNKVVSKATVQNKLTHHCSKWKRRLTLSQSQGLKKLKDSNPLFFFIIHINLFYRILFFLLDNNYSAEIMYHGNQFSWFNHYTWHMYNIVMFFFLLVKKNQLIEFSINIYSESIYISFNMDTKHFLLYSFSIRK